MLVMKVLCMKNILFVVSTYTILTSR